MRLVMSPVLLIAVISTALSASGAERARATLVVDVSRDRELPCGANQALGDALASLVPDARVVNAGAPASSQAWTTSTRSSLR